ncbi:YesK family protein [Bacillus toyonensis]
MNESWTIVILLLAVASLILFLFLIIRTLFPTKKYDKNLGLILIILSLLAIPISMFLIGGWAGLGIGIIAVLIFTAVIIALIANKFIKLPPPKKNKK